MTHFLDETGAIPDRPGVITGVRDHLGSIVAFVTSWSSTDEERSPVRCRRRPQRKACRGWIRARLDPDSREIVWICPVCRDRGVISGWEHTPWDLSDLNARPVESTSIRASFGGGGSPATAASPRFSPAAQRIWSEVDAGMRIRLLNSVWCSSCRGSCSMELLEGRVERGDLVLSGRCVTCGSDVARVVEGR
jgi:hypothetical protein